MNTIAKTIDNQSSAERILGALSDGVIGVNKQGLVTFINPVACNLLGWTFNEAAHQSLEVVFPIERSNQSLGPDFIQHLLQSQIGVGPITKQQLHNKAGDMLLIDYSITPLDSDSAVIMFHDLSHVQDSNRTMLYQVSYDPLTRLPNRDAISQTLEQVHHRLEAQHDTYSIMLFDLDHFKLINDAYGHSAGDTLLHKLARHLYKSLRPEDNLGRWGGEEFLCVLPNTDLNEAVEIAENMRELIKNHSVEVNRQAIKTSTSIGVSNFPYDGETPAEVLRAADAMLYEAKRNGRDRVRSSMKQKGTILTIARQLEEAINTDNIVPAYQPIVELDGGNRVAEEALARLDTRDNGLLEAGKFIEAALHMQLIHKIDHSIIKQTIMHCSTDVMNGLPPTPHFVNISADLLRHTDLMEDIFATAMVACTACGDRIGTDKPLVIEITEQQLLTDTREAKRILQPFLDFGLHLAVDDFGSGYSSLQYLADLPISYLKIEGTLVQRVTTDKKVRAIVKGIQNIANDLGLTTIAEFIEDKETVDVLRDIGVNWGQGYHFGRPATLNAAH